MVIKMSMKAKLEAHTRHRVETRSRIKTFRKLLVRKGFEVCEIMRDIHNHLIELGWFTEQGITGFKVPIISETEIYFLWSEYSKEKYGVEFLMCYDNVDNYIDEFVAWLEEGV